MAAYYNETDPFAVAWLRELIKADLIAPGEVDERSIEEVRPNDLRGFTQCHFFAGIGVWSHALRNAGWSDDSPVWTGSCPCQGFSASGQRGGFSDKRHLWPAWFRLIRECRPVTVFGEQVASKDGLAWLDVVSADMEAEGYAIGAADICAAGFGAPHIRQRLYFVGTRKLFWDEAPCGCWDRYAWHRKYGMWPWERCDNAGTMGKPDSTGPQQGRQTGASMGYGSASVSASGTSLVAPPECQQLRASGSGSAESETGRMPGANWQRKRFRNDIGERGAAGGLVNAKRGRRNWRQDLSKSDERRNGNIAQGTGKELTNGFWRDADWIFCRDGKWRPVEPGSFPLVNGTPNRVGRLRGYGNAINAEVAKAFIEAYMSIREIK